MYGWVQAASVLDQSGGVIGREVGVWGVLVGEMRGAVGEGEWGRVRFLTRNRTRRR